MAKKNLTRKNFFLTVAFAFPAFALLINTNSYFADKHHLNTAYLIAGIALVLVAAYFGYKTIKYGSVPEDKGL